MLSFLNSLIVKLVNKKWLKDRHKNLALMKKFKENDRNKKNKKNKKNNKNNKKSKNKKKNAEKKKEKNEKCTYCEKKIHAKKNYWH